eukprot:scaffold88060_cov56-Phaeocystis_antarctica.AAC.2
MDRHQVTSLRDAIRSGSQPGRRWSQEVDGLVGLCDPADLPVPVDRLGRRDARLVHVHAEAGRSDRVQRRATCRRPEVARAGEAARDDRWTREAAPGDVHVTVDAVIAELLPAAGRSRARAESGAHNRLGGDPADVPVPVGRLGRRDALLVHEHGEAGRGDRVLRRPTFRRPELARAGEAARDDRCTREAAPGDVHATVDAVSRTVNRRRRLLPAAGRSRARAE